MKDPPQLLEPARGIVLPPLGRSCINTALLSQVHSSSPHQQNGAAKLPVIHAVEYYSALKRRQICHVLQHRLLRTLC